MQTHKQYELDLVGQPEDASPEAPTFMTATEQQYRENAGPKRFGTDPDDKDGFFARACHGMLEEEDFWRQSKFVWAWVDERPVWTSPVQWDILILPEPERPTRRRFRFSLLGGGQLTVIEKFEIRREEILCTQQKLRVTANVGDGLRRFAGDIQCIPYEMTAVAVLFSPGTPQAVADRTAATFRLLTHANCIGTSNRHPDPENFAALLHRSSRCCMCRRPLRDHVSTLLGIGPDCAKQSNLPHNLEAATRISQRRKELLGESVS